MLYYMNSSLFIFWSLDLQRRKRQTSVEITTIQLQCKLKVFFCISTTTVWVRGIKTLTRNMLLLKNPQFLPNNYGTLSKWSAHEWVISTKCHNYWVKIVDFLIKPNFQLSPDSPIPVCNHLHGESVKLCLLHARCAMQIYRFIVKRKSFEDQLCPASAGLVTSNIFPLTKLFTKECLMYWIELKLNFIWNPCILWLLFKFLVLHQRRFLNLFDFTYSSLGILCLSVIELSRLNKHRVFGNQSNLELWMDWPK